MDAWPGALDISARVVTRKGLAGRHDLFAALETHEFGAFFADPAPAGGGSRSATSIAVTVANNSLSGTTVTRLYIAHGGNDISPWIEPVIRQSRIAVGCEGCPDDLQQAVR